MRTVEPGNAVRKEQGYEREVAVDKVRMFFREGGTTLVASWLAGVVWVGAVWGGAAHGALALWLSVYTIAIVSRMVLFALFQRTTPSDASTLRWFRRYVVVVLCSSTIWGAGAYWVVSGGPVLFQVATFVFLVSLSGASLVAYGFFPRLTLVVIVTLLLPIEVSFAASGNALLRWLALGGFLFSLSTVRSVFAYGRQVGASFQQAYQLREANRIAQWHAETDMLTGLQNRRAFTASAKALVQLAVREKQCVSMLVIDLDHFKEINDSYGHSVGDSLLVHVADLMQTSLRRSDICGRFGGDEFAILLPNTSLESAETVAEKIRNLAMQTTVNLDGLEVSVSLSIGIACGGEEGFDALMMRADHAMYQAKRTGRNQIVATHEI